MMAAALLLHSRQNRSISIGAQKKRSTWTGIDRVRERAPLARDSGRLRSGLLWVGPTITITPGLMEWVDIPFLAH